MAKLNDKQEMFIKEYMVDLNATQAAIRAGYSPKTAGKIAYNLMENSRVRAYIDIELAKRSKRVGINADRVLRELARIAFVDPARTVDTDEAIVLNSADENDTAAIASVKCKRSTSGEDSETVEREIKFHDKIKALDLLGKHLGMWDKPVDLSKTVFAIIDPLQGDDNGDSDN